MKKFIKKERGAFAIDAVFGITLFLFSILGIMCVSLVIKVQAAMQYAVDQTAKELSSYYYLLNKAGIADITSGATTAEVSEQVEKSNQLINNVFDFCETTESVAEDAENGINGTDFTNPDDIMNLISIAGNDYEALYSAASEIGSSVEAISDDPVGQVKAIVSVYAKTLGNKALSYYVTPYLCKLLMPKYITGDLESTNEYLESVGIEGGLSGENVSFALSSMLADGRSINIDVVYKLNMKKLTFGMIDTDLVLRQTATTAAWVKPNESGTLKSINDAYELANTGTDSE